MPYFGSHFNAEMRFLTLEQPADKQAMKINAKTRTWESASYSCLKTF
jgi:hypothetical protein